MNDRTEEVKTPFRRNSSIRQYGSSAMLGIGVRNSTNNIPLPVCVSDLIFLVDIPGEEEKYRISSFAFSTVRTIGAFYVDIFHGRVAKQPKMDENRAYVAYEICDSQKNFDTTCSSLFTIIQCLNVQQAEESTQNLKLYSVGTVISAVGKLCHFSGRLSLNSFQTRLVESDVEIEHFHLESRLAHLYYEKNLPEFSAAEMEEVSVPLFSTLPPSHSDTKCEVSQVQTQVEINTVDTKYTECEELVPLECDGYDISTEPISCAVEEMESSDQREKVADTEDDEFGLDETFICELEDGQPMQYYISKLHSDAVGILRSALIRILSHLHSDHLDDRSEITALIRALFQCLQMSNDLQVSDLIGKCLGAVGAIDNEKNNPLTHTITIENVENKSNIFVTDKLAFYQDFIRACVNLYTRCINSGKDETARKLANCVRNNYKKVCNLLGIGEQLSSNLSSDVELQVLLNFNDAGEITALSNRSMPCSEVINDRQLFESATDFSQWLRNWYCFTVTQMSDDTMKSVFLSLLIVNDDSVVNLMCQLLPSAILQVIIDDQNNFIAKIQQEITAVFSSFLEKPLDWVRNVVLTIFSIFDYIERYEIHKKMCKDITSEEKEALIKIQELMRQILGKPGTSEKDSVPLSVLVSERCNCYFRALKWLEQYGIARDVLGVSVFKRELFYRLEHLFISLEDVDGVDGAFSTISRKTTPTLSEELLAMQAVGKYNEALFLCQSARNQEIALVNCFLKLNQPVMARNTVECYLARSTVDDRTRQILYDQQIEALGKMSDWGQLGKLLNNQEVRKLGFTVMQSWGARLAGIVSALNLQDRKSFKKRLRDSRLYVVNKLSAITFESADAYSQSEKYIVRLRSLQEIEDVNKLVSNEDERKAGSVQLLLDRWKSQIEVPANSTQSLDPIISLRIDLIRAIKDIIADDSAEILCKLLLARCRISRRSGHMQTAFNLLTEARQTDVQSIEIDIEASRFYFQKNESAAAINVLEKAIINHYPEMADEFNAYLKNSRFGNKESFRVFEKRKPFVEAQLLLADLKERCGASRQEDLIRVYQGLEECGEKSEVFCFHYAVFFDSYCESKKEIDEGEICYLLKLYRSVLEQGSKYLQNVMPRMLTVWLDSSQKCPSRSSSKQSGNHGGNQNIRNPSVEISIGFSIIDHFYYYTSFSQLISRINHTDPTIFKTLKTILATLIADYPHQCLWHSIAIARGHSNPKSIARAKRCEEVYALAKKKATEIDLEQLIKHYDFLAASLIRVAEDSKTPASLSFSKAFPFLSQFFENGVMERGKNKEKSSRKSTPLFDSPLGSLPQLVIPFIDEVLEQQSHNESMLFSQIQVSRESVGVKPSYRFREVFITGVEESFEVLKSNANPKRIAFTASDGKKYPLLCKSNDELRKDSRFIDVEKMLNTLFIRDSDARRRSLFIRTFGVIPLQEAGGIIEWVPNLITLAGAAIPLQKEILKQRKVQMVTSNELQRVLNERLTKEQRVKNFRELYTRYPLVMCEWLRRNFQDACSWYNAKQSFTRTAATMSMVGFVLGLGDRHSENILIDQKSGDIVHVDFNLLFDKAEFLRIPEVVPFRLTRNMIDAFGSIGVQGTFRKACEITMRVMRSEERMLVTVLQTFVHDPLLEWHQIETRNQQTKQLGGTNPPETLEASKCLDMIAMRLSGNIVTAKFHRPKHNKAAMSVEGQVAMLIEMATDEVELSRMYIGWNPLL